MSGRDGTERRGRVMDPAGWEAFVHGVFAITITLLVLDIRVPGRDAAGTAGQLVDALLIEAPRYLAYALAFLYVGAYWMATHRSLRMARGVDDRFLVIGIVFLMSIAVLPFVSAVLAEYIGAGAGRDQVAVVLFMGWEVVVSLLAYLGLWYSSHAGLLKPDLDEQEFRRWLRAAGAAPVIWIAAFVAALFIGAVALAFPVLLLPVYFRGGAGGRRSGV